MTGQSITPGTKVRAGTTVALATVGPRVGAISRCQPNRWSQIAFADGEIVLSGLVRWGDCLNFDHATLGPDTTARASITVWVARLRHPQARLRAHAERVRPAAGARLDREHDRRAGLAGHACTRS